MRTTSCHDAIDTELVYRHAKTGSCARETDTVHALAMSVQGLTCLNAFSDTAAGTSAHAVHCWCLQIHGQVKDHSCFLQLHHKIVCWITPGWFPLPCPSDSPSLCWCMWLQHSVVSFCFCFCSYFVLFSLFALSP